MTNRPGSRIFATPGGPAVLGVGRFRPQSTPLSAPTGSLTQFFRCPRFPHSTASAKGSKMRGVGFEPTHLTIAELKSAALTTLSRVLEE